MPAVEVPDNPILNTLLGHKSVRRWKPEPLPPGTLELLAAAAQSAASSSNLQALSIVALQDPAHKARAAVLCGDQEFIKHAPLFLVFCADLSRLAWVSEQANLPGAGLDYLEMFLVAVIDAALAAQNAAIAAESMGLGICYVGAARNHPRELSELLGLPDRVFAQFGLAVGVPAGDDGTTIKPRLPQPGLLHHETYSETDRAASVGLYNTVMQDFYQAQGMNVQGDWSSHSAKRVAGKESLAGRDVLRETLESQGFPLK